MATTIEQTDVLSILHDLAQLLSGSLDSHIALERVMDAAIAATGAERGFLLLDKPGKGIEVEVARSFQKEDIKDPAFTASRMAGIAAEPESASTMMMSKPCAAKERMLASSFSGLPPASA